MADPSPHDVLSGRGVSFNRHPGNEHFRTLLEAQSDAYSTGTKKQKMAISKSIVEMIYSRDPPGRFLKKCPDTEKWVELSLKEAATRTSQAMAYTVREIAKHKKKRRSLRLQRDRGASVESSTEYGSRLESNNNSNASIENTGTVSVPSAASASTSTLGGEVNVAANLASRRNDTGELSGTANNNRVSVPAAGLQQQLLQIQLQQLGASSMPSAATLSSTANAGAPLNNLLLLLAQAQQQQQQAQLQLQQQLLLRQLLGQLPAQRSMLQNNNNGSDKTPVPSQNSATTLMELLRRSNLAQNQFPTHHSGPINTQALLSLLSILQSQPPTATAPTQFPWPAQQLLQVQHNQQLLASLLTRTNPPLVPPSLPPPPPQQQPLSMLQQQIAGLASNSASNPDVSTEGDETSSSIARGSESDKDNKASDG